MKRHHGNFFVTDINLTDESYPEHTKIKNKTSSNNNKKPKHHENKHLIKLGGIRTNQSSQKKE